MRGDFYIMRQGKQYVLFAGLLDEAHTKGLRVVDTELLQLPTETNNQVAIARARVTIEKTIRDTGKVIQTVFTGIGDASPNNVSRNIVVHSIRMSETRAKARALRDAVNSIAGTADVVAVEDTRVRVTDWKTGKGEIPHPENNYQLRFLGTAAARHFGSVEAVVQVANIGPDGSVGLREATLIREDCQKTVRDLRRIAESVDRAQAGSPVYRTGAHCRYCPALPHCPALSGAAQAIVDGPPEELTPWTAAEL